MSKRPREAAPMRALTLKSPHGHLIAFHGKNIENRSWRPNKTLAEGDWFAIHVGATFDEKAATNPNLRLAQDLHPTPLWKSADAAYAAAPPGSIACIAQFSGATPTAGSDEWSTGPQCWKLGSTRALTVEEQLKVGLHKGQRGLWQLPEEASDFLKELAQGTETPGKKICQRKRWAPGLLSTTPSELPQGQ